MQRQFFSGNSVDQAVMTAARHFGIEPERLFYKVRDKKTGFLNARRRVVIEVDPLTPALTDEEIQARIKLARLAAEQQQAASRAEAPRGDRPRAEAPKPKYDIGDDYTAQRAVPAVYEDEEEDGQKAFGLGVGQPPAAAAAFRAPARAEQGPARPQPEGGGRGGRKGRGDRPGPGARRGGGGGGERGGGERGGGERGGQDRGGRNRRGGPPQDRRARPGSERGHGRKGGRGEERPRRETIKVVEHTWKDGEWRELLTEEGDNVSREVLAFEKAIELILDVMDLDIEFSVSEGETFLVEFSGEDRERLVADEGRALKAIEHILPRIVRGMVGEALPCRVDCEDFQATREQELIELAKKTAEEVSKTLKPRLLPPMSPADRRIIHVTLMEDPDVDTMSEGDGFIKRIKIFPVRH